jgi:hypothetical protein
MRIGKRRTRMPVACQTALAMAPTVPVMPISPTPLDAERVDVRVFLIDEYRVERRDVGIHRHMVFGEIGVRDPPRAAIGDRRLVQGERDPPDHPAEILAAHEARVDDAASRERSEEAGHPDLAEGGVDLHFRIDGAMRETSHGPRRPPDRGRTSPCRSPRICRPGPGYPRRRRFARRRRVGAGDRPAPPRRRCRHRTTAILDRPWRVRRAWRWRPCRPRAAPGRRSRCGPNRRRCRRPAGANPLTGARPGPDRDRAPPLRSAPAPSTRPVPCRRLPSPQARTRRGAGWRAPRRGSAGQWNTAVPMPQPTRKPFSSRIRRGWSGRLDQPKRSAPSL